MYACRHPNYRAGYAAGQLEEGIRLTLSSPKLRHCTVVLHHVFGFVF